MFNLKSQFMLDPNIIFLNHGSFGSTPIPVFAKYQDFQKQLEYRPIEFLGRQCHALLTSARASVSEYLHTNKDNLVFVPNATTGINIVARSLNLHAGDEVLTTDHEYGAMDRTWRFLSTKSGFSYRSFRVKLPFLPDNEFVEDLFSNISDKTKVIYLSHISSPTSIFFPVKEICKHAKKMGILTVIDGAHAPGQIPLDLDDIGADFYTGNFHKWLCAPKGSAFLYANPAVQELLEPLIVSWGYESLDPGVSKFQDYFEWVGTKDISAYLSVPAAIQFQAENHWNIVRKHCHEIARSSLEEISSYFDLPSLYGSDKNFAQMVTIPVPTTIPALDLKNRLYDSYHIEIPVIEWENRLFIRLSVQGYNDAEEIYEFNRVIREIYSG